MSMRKLKMKNNKFVKRTKDNIFIFTILSLQITLSACAPSFSEKTQNSVLHLTNPPYKHFKQWPGDELNPSAYYTCKKYNPPCKCNLAVKKKSFHTRSLKAENLF